jgi:hypothetical protein
MYRSVIWLRMACLVMALYGCGTLEGYGQNAPQWPGKKDRTSFTNAYNDAKDQYGYILLKDGDTLRGKIKLLPYTDYYYREILFLALDKFAGRDIVFVPRYTISYVRTYPNPERPDTGTTDFVNLHNRDLWRALASKDGWTIYDDYTPNSRNLSFGYEMILAGKDKRWIKIYHHLYHDFDAEILPLILNFINKRYKMQFQPGDLGDVWALIHYILDKESGLPFPVNHIISYFQIQPAVAW